MSQRGTHNRAYTRIIFRLHHMIKALLVPGRQDYGFDFFLDLVSVNSPPENLIAPFDYLFHDATFQSLSNAYTPFIFRLHRIIKGITSTWRNGFLTRIFSIGQSPTRNLHGVISTAEFVALHSKSIQRTHQSSFLSIA
jgi:hypothetical protein